LVAVALKVTDQHLMSSERTIPLRATLRWGHHRYLKSRLSLQVFYLWPHVLSTAPLFILRCSNLELLFAPLHRSSPFIGGLRCQAIQTEHGPYIAERTLKAVNIVICLWRTLTNLGCQYSFLKGSVKVSEMIRG
jgi:hypothetical protein